MHSQNKLSLQLEEPHIGVFPNLCTLMAIMGQGRVLEKSRTYTYPHQATSLCISEPS